jgi:hypothetical protein
MTTSSRTRTEHLFFCRYVENETVSGWTWRRITESRAEHVIALGRIAEHGLLRLFNRLGAKISCKGEAWKPNEYGLEWDWVNHHADSCKRLSHWQAPGNWWTISTQERDITMLPVYHPSAAKEYDLGYVRTREALIHWLGR